MRKIKHVFKESLARKLSNSGYPIVSIRKDRKNKDRYVFLFEETEPFKRELTELTNER